MSAVGAVSSTLGGEDFPRTITIPNYVCRVCSLPLKGNNPFKRIASIEPLACGHTFHEDCSIHTILAGGLCPICGKRAARARTYNLEINLTSVFGMCVLVLATFFMILGLVFVYDACGPNGKFAPDVSVCLTNGTKPRQCAEKYRYDQCSREDYDGSPTQYNAGIALLMIVVVELGGCYLVLPPMCTYGMFSSGSRYHPSNIQLLRAVLVVGGVGVVVWTAGSIGFIATAFSIRKEDNSPLSISPFQDFFVFTSVAYVISGFLTVSMNHLLLRKIIRVLQRVHPTA